MDPQHEDAGGESGVPPACTIVKIWLMSEVEILKQPEAQNV